PAVVTADLSRKTLVPIGANAGLGFETAKRFAKVNPAQLVLTAKNEAKGEEAVARVLKETGYTNAGLWIIDVANFSSVIAFVDRAESEFDRLDILVENVGMTTWEYERQLEDWERTYVDCSSRNLAYLSKCAD
ncbi:uncharacterized protein EV420DRAFT_1270663, partial [Desarmillaria tabescens]